jgi:hypothetical protein
MELHVVCGDGIQMKISILRSVDELYFLDCGDAEGSFPEV